jgi:transcriptional regulator of acetoin/glycerol metabolism
MTPEERVKEAWANLTMGPGWEKRLSALMADAIRAAEIEVEVNIQKQETYGEITYINCPGCGSSEYFPIFECKYCGRFIGDDKSILTIQEVERQAIIHAGWILQGHIAKMANALGIGRTTLWRKMKAFSLSSNSFGKSSGKK